MAGSFSFTSPIALNAIRGELPDGLKLHEILDFNKKLSLAVGIKDLPDLGQIPLPIDRISIRPFKLIISQIDQAALGLRKGITAAGTLYFDDSAISDVEVVLQKNGGVICKSWISPFYLGPVCLTGDGRDGKAGTSDDGSIFNFEYNPQPTDGSTPLQQCYINARATILGAPFTVFLDLKKDGGSGKFFGDLNGFQCDFSVSGKGIGLKKNADPNADISVVGTFRQSFSDKVVRAVSDKVSGNSEVSLAINTVGGTLFAVKSVSFSESLNDINSGKIEKLSVTACTFEKSIAVSVDNFDLMGSGFNNLVDKLAENVISIAESFMGDFGNFAKQAISRVAKEADEVFKKSADVIGVDNAANYASDRIKDSIETAQRTVGDISNATENAVNQAVDNLNKVWNGINNVF
ncbi:MAG: hypothetical protein HQM08_22890 [Candidatus Riflebacteria bacterium]|nr:hypothetical protein [Candidatus Riflebacteria bacterium]